VNSLISNNIAASDYLTDCPQTLLFQQYTLDFFKFKYNV